jgi:hypothetical protein
VTVVRSLQRECTCGVVRAQRGDLATEAIVEERVDCPVHAQRWRDEGSSTARGENVVSVWKLKPASETQTMHDYARLYRDGDSVAISTNVAGEQDFVWEVGNALGDMLCRLPVMGVVAAPLDEKRLGSDLAPFAGDFARALQDYLPQIIEIACKLRGYKAPSVDEQRVLTVGRLHFSESLVVGRCEDTNADTAYNRSAEDRGLSPILVTA